MDLAAIYQFWHALDTQDICGGLGAVLMVLFEIVHEWQPQETEVGKDVGMGMNPRKAILWHFTEFMTDDHISRLRTSKRRKLSSAASQSVKSSMDSQQTLLQEKADEERKEKDAATIRGWINTRVVHKIRGGGWIQPEPVPEMGKSKWPHWDDLRKEAEEFWEHDGGWRISEKKGPFLQMVYKAFWDLVVNRPLFKYRGTVAAAATSSLDRGEGIRDGNCIGENAMAAARATEKEDDHTLTPEKERNLKRVAEALSATELLTKMSWLHDCPDTAQHWNSFAAIMNFVREHIREPTLQAVQSFMQQPDFPSSLRAWSIMAWVALKELEGSGQIPRFLSAPTDQKIRQHANLAPDYYADPGNIKLDLTFFSVCFWEFVCPRDLQNILKLSWKDYGSQGEKSSQGPMNFRGNMLEALIGYCHAKAFARIRAYGLDTGRF